MKQVIRIFATAACLALAMQAVPAGAEESTGEKIQSKGRDAKSSVKKAGRKIKDKTCKWVKGELECAGDQVKHGVKNVIDKGGDKVKDGVDKAD